MYPFAEEEKGVSFLCPAPTSFDKYLEHIDQNMGPDTPIAFGLHPNAEIDFRTTQTDILFRTLLELQPRDTGGDAGESISPDKIAKDSAIEILDKYAEKKFIIIW